MPRCKTPSCNNRKFESKTFNQKHCLQTEECRHFAFNKAMHNVQEKRKKDYKKAKKEWSTKKRKMKISAYSNKYKKELQRNINLLSRMIDKKFGYKTCIDCNRGYGSQTDASHFHNVKGNENIRYNLHNLHSANSSCNQFHGGRKEEYYDGLKERYSKSYADYIKYDIRKQYKRLQPSEVEIYEALEKVRKIIRELDSLDFENSIQARDELNNRIGFYKKKFSDFIAY